MTEGFVILLTKCHKAWHITFVFDQKGVVL